MTKPQSFSLDEETIAIVDDFARQIEAEHPGVRISRSAAVRALVKRATDTANEPKATE